ncbi:MAG TPA: Rieske (2Fe-2S) protein, partial [Verrucomicrobiota bacterium]|nr:Rieske (2Fe-2S) protein [Verrucomicrobiota bacterium]
MSFDDFSQLKNSYGSVRLNVPGIPSSSSQIVVTRMPGNQFYAVSAKCTHKGVAVDAFKKGVGLRCPAHFSQFEANGKVVKSPARSS